jgi:serine phosphatase RsbU (regulator of sigma subunit)
LLTDGVVEAHGKTGALFGFERTAAISSQSASRIAETAELFGQDDDITVLTLMRESVEPLTANPLPVPSFAL